MVATCVAYMFAICLVIKERRYLLPSTPSHGHGLVLLATWTLQLIVENLALINMKSSEWQDFEPTRNKVEMLMFGLRYITCLYIFVLGLKAPGIARPINENYSHLAEGETDVSRVRNTVVDTCY